MEFEWDDRKERANIAKHGISFAQAARIFEAFTLSWSDRRAAYGEERAISIGQLGSAAILVVAHTDRQGRCRIISARPANRNERQRYDQALRDTLEL